MNEFLRGEVTKSKFFELCLNGRWKSTQNKIFYVIDVIRRFKIRMFKESCFFVFFFSRIRHKGNLSRISPLK